MMLKAAFILLLGSALVLATPVPENSENEVALANESTDLALFNEDGYAQFEALVQAEPESPWSRFKLKMQELLQRAKAKFNELTGRTKGNVESIKAKVLSIKNETAELLETVEETFDKIKDQGKEALKEFKEISQVVSETWVEFKGIGVEAYHEFKQMFVESRDAFKSLSSKWANVKHLAETIG